MLLISRNPSPRSSGELKSPFPFAAFFAVSAIGTKSQGASSKRASLVYLPLTLKARMPHRLCLQGG